MSKHQKRLAEALARFDTLVRTNADGTFQGAVLREGDEVWYDKTKHANRFIAFSRACRESDLLAEELVEQWEQEDDAERGDGSCGACGGSGHRCPRCGNTGRDRYGLGEFIVSMARAHAAAVTGGAL